MKIFISYRRDDSIVHAKLIHNELAARFGANDVFMDIDDIDYGDDFARRIDATLDTADVVVAVIGPRWLDMLQQRLHGDDYVRHELARALSRGIRVVPVLVDKAQPPGAELPDDLAGLRTLNALNLDPRALKPHLNALVETVQGRSFEDVAKSLQANLRSQRRAQWVGAGVGLSAFFAGWVAVLDFVGLDTRLASATMTLAHLAGPVAPWSDQVALVAIDEQSVHHVGRSFDASWRGEHARLIAKLAAAGARSVAFDFFVERPDAPAADAALEAAVAAARPMPVAFAVGRMDGDRPLLLPRLADVASGGIGCAGEKLGYARSMPLAVQRGAMLFPSLALAAYSGGGKIEALDARAQTLRVRLVREEVSPDLPFSLAETARAAQSDCEAIRAGDTVALQLLDPARAPDLRAAGRRWRYEDVLDGSVAALAPLKNKIVLVGLQLRNQDEVPLPGGRTRWGMELIGEQVDGLVRGDVVRTLRAGSSLATMMALAFAGAYLRVKMAGRPRWSKALVASAGVLACAAAAIVLYRAQHVLMNFSYAVLAFLLAWGVSAWLEMRGVR